MNRNILLAIVLALSTGCAAKIKTVPLKVQSDPLGGYVLYQMQADIEDERNYDWIFLGSTPLDTRRAITSKNLKNADAFVLRVVKEGFHDQQKSWTGKQMVEESKSKGAVFWNPRLVPAN